MNKTGSRVRGPWSGITVQNLHKKFRINERFIKKLVKKILSILKKPQNTELEVIFLSDSAIRKLNKKYKDRDSSTDVLSFNLGGMGEVIVSTDTAMKNFYSYGTSFESEVVLYVIHGILHLFGFNDNTVRAARSMAVKQGCILEKICAKENLSKVLMPQ